MIVNKLLALMRVTKAPVVCDHCGAETEFGPLDIRSRQALIDASYLHHFQSELGLLKRTADLFQRFPRSRHPIKLDREPPTWHSARDDPEFDSALQSDPELAHFLRNSYFTLSERLPFVSEQITVYLRLVQNNHVICPSCGHPHLRLGESFFDQLI